MNAPDSPPPASTSGRRRKTGMVRQALVWLLGLGLVAALIAGFRPRPIEVETAIVAIGPMQVSVLEEGKTRIRHRHVISPPVAGMLERIPLRAGDKIEAGKTVLATLHPAPANFLDPRAKAEAEARVLAAQANQQLRTAQRDRAQSALELAHTEKKRNQQLLRSGAISQREMDLASNQVDLLERELRAAGFAVQVSEYELAQARAAARQASGPEAAVEGPLVLKAPVSGFVLTVMEESARAVTPGLALMEVGDPNDLEAEIELLSSDAVSVQPGAEVSIEKWGGESPLRGRVSVIEPGGYTKFSALGVEEQRVKVRVDFLETPPDGKWLGDRYRVEARIRTWQADAVMQVPSGALFRRGEDWMTFLFDDGQARAIKVTTQHNNGITAEITGGLGAGQIVLLHPPDKVVDGSAVVMRK
jgi:HlyD family secretion protein